MALNQYETDEQRAEVLIDWLKRNIGYLLLLVVIVVGSIIGVGYYKSSSDEKLTQSFDTYHSFLSEYESQPIGAVTGEKLVANNDGIYKVFSAMMLAKEAHGAGNYDDAKLLLTDAIENNDAGDGVGSLLQYRLAIVLFDQGENDAALAELKKIQAPEFVGLRKVLEGDIYQSMGRVEDAKISYEEALGSEVVPDSAQGKLDFLSVQ